MHNFVDTGWRKLGAFLLRALRVYIRGLVQWKSFEFHASHEDNFCHENPNRGYPWWKLALSGPQPAILGFRLLNKHVPLVAKTKK